MSLELEVRLSQPALATNSEADCPLQKGLKEGRQGGGWDQLQTHAWHACQLILLIRQTMLAFVKFKTFYVLT